MSQRDDFEISDPRSPQRPPPPPRGRSMWDRIEKQGISLGAGNLVTGKRHVQIPHYGATNRTWIDPNIAIQEDRLALTARRGFDEAERLKQWRL